MAFTEKRIGAILPTMASLATLYAVPTDTTTVIKNLQICNNATLAALSSVFLTPTGDTPDTTTAILYEFSVPAKQAINWEMWQVLENGAIMVKLETGSSTTYTASGMEIT